MIMKKTFLVLSVLFSLSINFIYAQIDTIPSEGTLINAIPLCDTQTDSFNYILSHNGMSAESGPNYGCCNAQPNPSWFYIKTTDFDTSPINITIDAASDLDFVVWGPFEDITYNYDSLQADHIIDCEYAALNETVINIEPVVLDSYYMVMITNYYNDASVLQPYVGSGTIECEINQAPVMQEYISFPTENATWVNTSYSISVSEENPVAVYHLNNVDNFCVNGEDTIISEKNYTKVNYCEGAYKGALRDEAGIVYYCPKDSSNEYVLYDFTVAPGDTVFDVYIEQYPLGDVIIQAIDSVLINGYYRKLIRLKDGGEWIEGIGCTQGLFMEPWYNVSFYELRLNCFSQNDTVLFPNYSIGACSLTVGEEEIVQSHLSLYPNPATSFVNIDFSNLQESNPTINIYAIDGSLKTSIINKEEQLLINTEAWSKGIYFIQVTTHKKSYTQKFIVQ